MTGDGAVVMVSVPHGEADLAASRLWDLGAIAIEERDAPDGTLLVTSFDVADHGSAIAAIAAEWPVQVEAAGDASSDHWLDAWRAFATPVTVGRVVVRPAWVPYTSRGDELVVTIDPGRSFGVGNHPTTQLALAALVDSVRAGDRVLDVGCGSGVLAIAAALLGASHATATDVEPRAIVDTHANAERNGVVDRVAASITALDDLAATYDVVVANLGGAILPVMLAPALLRRVRAGGTVIASGMLGDEQGHAVRTALGAAALGDRVELRAHGDWRAVVLSR